MTPCQICFYTYIDETLMSVDMGFCWSGVDCASDECEHAGGSLVVKTKYKNSCRNCLHEWTSVLSFIIRKGDDKWV